MTNYIHAAGQTTARIRKYLLSDLSYVSQSPPYGTFYTLAEDATHVYGGGSDFIVRKFLKSDMSLVASSVSTSDSLWGLAVEDDTHIYAAYANHRLRKLLKSDLSAVALYDPGGYNGPFYALAEDTDYLYVAGFAAGQEVIKVQKSDMTEVARSPAYSVTPAEYVRALVEDSTHVYGGGNGPQTVWKILKSDMSKLTESPDYGGAIYALAEDDTYVYAAGSATQTIRRYLKSDLSYVDESPDYGGLIRTLAISGTHIYAGGGTTQTIRKYLISDLSYVSEGPDYGDRIYAVSLVLPPTVTVGGINPALIELLGH